jgi:hypothetical protein
MLLPAHQSTGRHFREERNLNIHRRENVKSDINKCSEPLHDETRYVIVK